MMNFINLVAFNNLNMFIFFRNHSLFFIESDWRDAGIGTKGACQRVSSSASHRKELLAELKKTPSAWILFPIVTMMISRA